MQKNKEAEKKGGWKKAILPIAVAVSLTVAGAVIGHEAPFIDYDHDGYYDDMDVLGSTLMGAGIGGFSASGVCFYMGHLERKNKNQNQEENQADSYGHVKAV